jgi:hypothetical protein
MGKSIIFTGTELSKTNDHKLEVFAVLENEIFINIEVNDWNAFINLDRSTAIKFHRELKKQISFLEESEVSNG